MANERMESEDPCGDDEIKKIKNNLNYLLKKNENFINLEDYFLHKEKKTIKRKSPRKRNTGKPLAALEEVFLENGVRDEILLRLGVPQLLRGQLSSTPGVIFYGPPGTGKSVLARAYCNLFEDNGSYSNEVSLTELNSSYVGQFARGLMKVLDEAKNESAKRGQNSLLFLDEADSLVVRADYGASSVSKHYQEAINELKRQLEEGNNDGLTALSGMNKI
jgi:cell division protease FtsH